MGDSLVGTHDPIRIIVCLYDSIKNECLLFVNDVGGGRDRGLDQVQRHVCVE